MRLIKLTAQNFKRLRDNNEYNFPEGIVGITGSNGRGKSTIGAAVAWVLFGPDILQTGKADVVTWGANECSVHLIFELNDVEYTIYRSQKKDGSGNASLYANNTDKLSLGIDPTNREIERILGVDRVGFLTSVYARQEELTGIMSLTPANRIKTVLRLLGVEQLTGAIERVRSEARDARKELEGKRVGFETPDAIETELMDTESILGEVVFNIGEHNDRLALIEVESNHLVNEAVELIPQRKAFEQYSERVSKARIAFTQAESELRSTERSYSQIAPAPRPGSEPEPVDEEYMEDTAAKLASVRTERKELFERINTITKSSRCFACDRPFDHAADMEAQIVGLEQRDTDLLDQDYTLYAELTICRNRKRQHMEWELATRNYATYQERCDDVLDRIEYSRHQIAASYEYLQQLFAEPVKDDVSEKLDKLQEKRLETERAAGQIRESLATLAEQERNLRSGFESAVDRLMRSNALNTSITTLEAIVVNKETAAKELSNLKESMIGQAIPMISERSSELVAKFTDGRYTEVNLTPDYEIQYRNDLGELKSFENLSGGEKDVFALALRLAIADLRADSIGVLLLDEVLESLDVERQEATWGAIERLTSRYQQVFIITHVQAFKDRAATVISV